MLGLEQLQSQQDGWKDITAARPGGRYNELLSLAFSSLLPPALTVMAVPTLLLCFVLGLLISFSSMRMLLRQSDYSSQQKLNCLKAPKIYPEVHHFA